MRPYSSISLIQKMCMICLRSHLKVCKGTGVLLFELQHGEIVFVYVNPLPPKQSIYIMATLKLTCFWTISQMAICKIRESQSWKQPQQFFPWLVSLWSKLFKTDGPSSHFKVLKWCLPLAKFLSLTTHLFFFLWFERNSNLMSDLLDPFVNLHTINATWKCF